MTYNSKKISCFIAFCPGMPDDYSETPRRLPTPVNYFILLYTTIGRAPITPHNLWENY